MGGGTYSEISEMLNAHYNGLINIADYWDIGDTRTENVPSIPNTLTNDLYVNETQPSQSIELCIIGLNHDDLETAINGINKAAITVQTKDCLSYSGFMNLSGTGYTEALWGQSQRREWCNNNFYNSLPIDLQPLIKNVIKLSNRYSNIIPQRTQANTVDKIFLLSLSEVCAEDFSYGYDTTYLEPDGEQYEYMITGSNKIKNIGTSASNWWTRTGTIEDSNNYIYFFRVNSLGVINGASSPTTYLGIAPAFCL